MGEIIEMTGGRELLAFAGYQDFEAAADKTAQKIKEGYMEMGCILKMARDTDILRESGYTGYEEFAEKRYGLDKGTVSRYIRIVERFSVGGNSHILKDNYRNMGFAKLSIMLHMPDAIAEELMDSLSKTEVQAIREELEAENAISDIEVAIEAAQAPVPPVIAGEENLLTRAVWQLCREQQDLFRKLWQVCKAGEERGIPETLVPQGDAVYMVRIPGTGRIMMAVTMEKVVVTEVRTQNKETYTMQEMQEAVWTLLYPVMESPAEKYRMIYDEDLQEEEKPEPKPEPKKKEVAPVQPKKRKESKVTKAVTEKPAPAAVVEEEEQLPGQMDVEDYPGVVPEVSYQEIGEEKADAEGTNGDITGVSGNAGVSGDALEPVSDEGDTAEIEDAGGEPADSTGAAEGRGRETDAAEVEEDIWMDVRNIHQKLNQYLTVWGEKETLMEKDVLQSIYQMSVDLAAAVERVMVARNAMGAEDE